MLLHKIGIAVRLLFPPFMHSLSKHLPDTRYVPGNVRGRWAAGGGLLVGGGTSAQYVPATLGSLQVQGARSFHALGQVSE